MIPYSEYWLDGALPDLNLFLRQESDQGWRFQCQRCTSQFFVNPAFHIYLHRLHLVANIKYKLYVAYWIPSLVFIIFLFFFFSILIQDNLNISSRWSVVQMVRAKFSASEKCQYKGQLFMFFSFITHKSPSTIPASNKSLPRTRNWTITSTMMLMTWGTLPKR